MARRVLDTFIVPVGMQHDNDESREGGDHDEDLRDVQSPLLVRHVVQDDVRQRIYWKFNYVKFSI